VQQIRSPNREISLWVQQRQGISRWPRGWWGRSARGGTAWNWCALVFLEGRGEESTAEGILMVIHGLVDLLPREYPARLPQLTRVGGPRRLGGGLTQKPCENPNLPGML
jgi:hypothetical protein